MKKQDYILLSLLILSIVIVSFNDVFFNETPEIFSKGSEIGRILSNLSLAYIASYIFYLIVVKYQENENKRNIYSTVHSLSKQLVGRGNSVVTVLASANNALTPGLTKKISKEEYIELCRKTNPKEISPNTRLGTIINPVQATYSQLIYNDSFANSKALIESIFVYMPFLESEFVKLLNDLKGSTFFLMANILANPHGFKNTNFENMADSMYTYHLKLREIENYVDSNYKKYIC